jgi:branched-chain amino acid transport system substrate-binding protein
MSLIRRTLALFAAALSLPACSGSAPPPPVLLGHVAALSGPDREAGQSAARGIRLAVMEANKDPDKGAGRTVKVIHTDTLGALDAYEAEAVRLVTINRTAALLGGTTQEEVERLERARVPVVSPCGTRPRSRNEAVFTTGLSPSVQGKLLGRFAADRLKASRALALADQADDNSVALAEAFGREFQAERAKKDAKGAKGEQARPEVLRYGKEVKLADLARRIAAEKPAAVLLAGNLADLRQLRKDLGEKAPALLFGGEDGAAQAVQEGNGKGAVYLVTAWAADGDAPRAQEFAKKYRETFGQSPDVHAALAYDNARLLFEALRRTKDDLTGARLRDELAGLKGFAGLTGPLSFGEDRQLRRPAFVLRVENGQVKTEKRYGPEPE